MVSAIQTSPNHVALPCRVEVRITPTTISCRAIPGAKESNLLESINEKDKSLKERYKIQAPLEYNLYYYNQMMKVVAIAALTFWFTMPPWRLLFLLPPALYVAKQISDIALPQDIEQLRQAKAEFFNQLWQLRLQEAKSAILTFTTKSATEELPSQQALFLKQAVGAAHTIARAEADRDWAHAMVFALSVASYLVVSLIPIVVLVAASWATLLSLVLSLLLQILESYFARQETVAKQLIDQHDLTIKSVQNVEEVLSTFQARWFGQQQARIDSGILSTPTSSAGDVSPVGAADGGSPHHQALPANPRALTRQEEWAQQLMLSAYRTGSSPAAGSPPAGSEEGSPHPSVPLAESVSGDERSGATGSSGTPSTPSV